MRVFLESIFFQFICGAIVWWFGRKALRRFKSLRLVFDIVFLVEIITYLIGNIFHKDLPDDILIFIMNCCDAWYIALLYMTMMILTAEFALLIIKWFRIKPQFFSSNLEKIRLALFVIIPICVTVLMIKGYHNVEYPIKTHVNITLKKGSSQIDSLKIAFMSDLHIGEVIKRNLVHRYVTMCNEEKPDIILIGGDIMDFESRFAENMHCEEELRQLKAPLGVYMILGNHEYRANRFAKFRWLKKTGATLLVDSVVEPAKSFYLVGRDDLTNKDRQPLQTLLRGLDRTKPVIVLDHQPVTISEMEIENVALSLHGHTHNGQIWPYNYFIKLTYPCSHGYYRRGPTQVFVTSGIGVAGPPFRVGTHSELVILHVKFK